MITIKISTRLITRIFLIVFLLLLLAHLSAILLKYKFLPQNQLAERLDEFLNFDREVNFPTYFNTILLFLSALSFLLIGITQQHAKFYFKTYWFILSAGFLFLSIDEFIRIHEWFIGWTPRLLGVGGSGILKFAWIIPYGFVAIAFGLYSIRFLKSIDRYFALRYVLCGALYLCGTIGMESIGGIEYEASNDSRTFEYILYYTTIEESMEMIALILLLNFNMKYLTSKAISSTN